MKAIPAVLWLALYLLSGCQSRVAPSDVWAEGCIELVPHQGGYLLRGVCCEYVLLPDLKTIRQGSFTAKGTYHSYTGAGFSSTPTEVRGVLSSGGKLLTVAYTVHSQQSRYQLKPGRATVICDCGCD
jgi:hypothetical protein